MRPTLEESRRQESFERREEEKANRRHGTGYDLVILILILTLIAFIVAFVSILLHSF